MFTLSDTARAVLIATPTGHDDTATAAQIAARAGIGAASAAVHLGRLAALGLVERAEDLTGYGATWCRFDSVAPGLEPAQVAELIGAEAAEAAQVEALAEEIAQARADAQAEALAAWAAARAEVAARDLARAEALAAVAYATAEEVAEEAEEAAQAAQEAEEAARMAEAARQAAQAATAQAATAQAIAEATARALVAGAPATLNGAPVLAVAAQGDRLRVLVDRGADSAHRFVVASWWPGLGRSWSWGHYFATAQEVREYLAAEAQGRALEARRAFHLMALVAADGAAFAPTGAAQEIAEGAALDFGL